MRKTKVIFVINTFGNGGAENVFSHIVSGLDGNKFDITLALGKKTGDYLERVPKEVKIVELSGFTSSYRSLFPLVRLINSIEPDVVVSTLGMITASAVARRFVSKDIVFLSRIGTTISADFERVRRISYIKYIIQRLSYLYTVKSTHVLAQSVFMKNDIVRIFNVRADNIDVIYNPVYSSEFEFPGLIEEEGNRLVAIGRCSWEKGYDHLISAIKILVDEGRELKLHFIGDGPIKHELETMVIKYGLENNIIFEGYIKNPFTYIPRANTITVSSSRYEGFSNVIVESIANEIPVVVTDCPSGNREVVIDGYNGWFCSVKGDVSVNIAEKLRYALENHSSLKRKDISDDVISKFGYEKIIEQYQNLLLKLSKR